MTNQAASDAEKRDAERIAHYQKIGMTLDQAFEYAAALERGRLQSDSEWSEELERTRAAIAEIQAELAEAQKHIYLAEGYHARTAREIEIANALDDTPADLRDSADNTIAELLDLVDAGRSRLRHTEAERDAAQAELKRAREERSLAVANLGHAEEKIAELQEFVREHHQPLAAEVERLKEDSASYKAKYERMKIELTSVRDEDELHLEELAAERIKNAALKEQAEKLGKELNAAKGWLLEKVFHATERDRFKRTGYTLFTDTETAYRDIDYRDCPMFETARLAVDAAIERTLKEDAAREGR